MKNENTKLISIYNSGIEYLEELCPQGIDLNKYFKVKKMIPSINGINLQLCNSLQNRNQMPMVIKFDINRITLNEIFFDFEPKKIINFYDEQSLYSRFKEAFNVKNADSPRNLWLQYAKFVLSASRFMSRFKTGKQFDQFIKVFSKNDLTRAALPILLSKEIAGLGFALACDFVKELGYSEYPKPDVHLNTIFSQLDICDNDDYEVYKAIIRMAAACGKTAYQVDKVFWLISSGRYYLDDIVIKGKRTEFIERVKLSEGCS
ncbi:MAG: hypothetical protein Q8S24_01875 [Eubacteriales bacterium]|nr:hypothetical protein [Eubacteriales bacterium]